MELYIKEEIKVEMKRIALEQDKSLLEILEEALEEYIKRYKEGGIEVMVKEVGEINKNLGN